MHWKATTILLCIYGVVKEFRPATPFLTPFLVSSYKNLTLDQVYGEIFPYWTYSYMILLIPAFILTDILRYKPIIVLEGASLCATWALLVWGEGVRQMQLMQICFGLASAAEIAYYSYLYAVVDEVHYRTVTSYIRSAALVGKLLAFALAQFLVSTGLGSYLLLNQKGIGNYFLTILRSFTVFKDNMVVLRWSVWWALTSCGVFQIYNYIQSLWLEMQPDHSKVENGLVEFSNTSIGAVLAFLVQFAHIDWHRYGEVTLIISSAFIAIVLAVVSQTNQILVAYIGYVCMTSTYHMLITAASFNIASELTSINYGLVFGWNTFSAVVLQTVLTLIVVDSHGFGLSIRSQFVVYASYFGTVSIIFLAAHIWSRCSNNSFAEEDRSERNHDDDIVFSEGTSES
ncbi:unnamed protein product [Nippostrongylus brasiliensis]|uniref:Folate transporter 1 (inferred by orthology to a C. elegans protein) n=1 Tax=Nippostrongylus brasiliensis TaxID=27835 RepID=A0A0N4Y5Q3_NIPBR|nr:unnamed protein product [Nippostrongylus brasiliensis]